MAMKVKAARGVLWSFLEYGGGEGISFIVFLVLARLVAPEDFGIVALAGVFVAFVQVFLLQGFADAIIQRQKLTADHCSTAFWSNVAIAGLFFLATEATADRLAAAFAQPRLAEVLRWLSLVFISTALISTHQAVFKRELQFRSFALRALVGITAGGAVGVVLALKGFGVWALVGQQLTNGLASVIVIWSTSSWRPRLRFSKPCFREMAPFAGNVVGSNLVGFMFKKLDVFLIGWFFDAELLGYYYLVQRLLVTVGLLTLSTVQSIVMPVLSRLQGDRERFNGVFATTIQLVHAIWLPLVLGMGLIASPLLPLLFGAKWQPSVPLMEIMTLTAFSMVFSFFSGPVLYAAGQPQSHLRLSLIQVAITVLIFLPLTQVGLIGVAISYALSYALIAPLHLFVLQRDAGVNPWWALAGCRAPTGAAIAMAIAVLALKAELLASLSPVAALIALVMLGVAVYCGMLALFAPNLVRRVVGLVESALGRQPVVAP
jgi:O-antigen/teichoic acid export membrane protein